MSKPIPSPINDVHQSGNASPSGANHPGATNADERRQTPRFPLKAKMFLARVDGLPAAITLKNISCGGASGLMSEPITEGTRLVLELDPRTHVEAEVRWVSKMVIGLKFLTPLEPSYVTAMSRRYAPED